MAGNVAGSGKSEPRIPSPSRPVGAARPPTATTAKPVDTVAKSNTNPVHGLDALKQLGRYTIIKKLGQGGMGTVFLANDTQLRRQVALKVLAKEKAENPTLVKRFKAEAQAAAALKHDNIVAIHDAGEADGYLYIALEFIDGTDAHTIVAKRGPMPAKRAMDVIRQTALALQHAHAQKIVHRDIKPSNLLIAKNGTVKLADMGLARSVDETLETNITRAGTTVGTVDYMSPEQARNSKAADIRSDLYSLGATWFHLLTGHPPFPEGSMLNKLNAHSVSARPDVRDENDSVSENISVMIKRLLAIKPEDRYQTPTELLEDLDNENLTRGPMSLKDLAALAEEDDDGAVADEGPKSSYKKPVPKEAKQLAAATIELKSLKATPVVEASASGMNAGALKMLGIGGAVIAAIGILGYIASEYGGAVATTSGTSGDPFHRGNDIAAAAGSNSTGGPQTGNEKRAGPKPATGGTQNGPAPIPITDGSMGPNVAKSPAGALFIPPLVPLGREGEVQHIPEWITEAGSSAPASLKTINVGGGPNGFEQVATLEQALHELPEAGGLVELITDGPYFLNPTQLKNRATVVIRAATGRVPVLVLVAEPDQPYDSLLHVTNGALTLEGLHILVDARQFASNDLLTLVNVQSGDLAVIRCSFTLLGSRAGKTFAMGAEGKVHRSEATQSSRARLFARESVVRGAALGAFQIDQTQTDLVASRCVFATGSAPVLRLSNHESLEVETPPTKPAAGVGKVGGKSNLAPADDSKKPAGPKSLKPTIDTVAKTPSSAAARRLKFLSCSVLSSATAFELTPGVDIARPPTTEILIVNSVLAGVNSTQAVPVLLALPGWQSSPSPVADQSSYPNLSWQFECSAICGWPKLILEEPGVPQVVRDGSAWKGVWRNQPSLDLSQFQTGSWPKSTPADFASLSPNGLGVPVEFGLKGTDGQTPGCADVDFASPTALTLARADALMDRAAYPIAGLEPFVVNRRIEVDANTQDLGKVLATDDWPNGTLVIVRGHGKSGMTPVEVKNKSLRIEFQNTGEAPLVFEPRKSNKSKEDEAMFIVEGGSLELVDGQFQFSNGSSLPMPGHFLSVHDGSFSLRRCQITGQMLDGTSGFQGLIRWKRSTAEPGDLANPAERNSGVIVDSALMTSGKLLDADLRNRTLLLRNSLFASVGDLFDLNVQGFSRKIGGTLDARWCTFGAGGKFLFQIRGAKEAEKANRPLNLFVQHSVLLALTEMSGATTSPVLLSARDHVLTNQQIAWWDHGNGYSAPWTQFIRAADTPAAGPQAFDSHWRNKWGDTRVVNSLTANGDVRLIARLPPRTNAKPRDFLLAGDCAAATWGPNQTPIGVDFERWTESPKSPSRVTGSTTTGSTTTGAKKSESPPANKNTKPAKPNF